MEPSLGAASTGDMILTQLFAWFGNAANWSGADGIPQRVLEHLELSLLSLCVAGVIALPVGLVVGHARRAEFAVVTIANLGRAIPSFAIVALFFPITVELGLGLGFWPTFLALVLLGIPPILMNTYVGVKGVDQSTVEAATGMGMSGREVLTGIEIPLAAPLIVAGLRTSAVQIVATATLGAVVGWGGLGRYIIDGFAQQNARLLAGGAVLVALLAMATEVAFAALERGVRPKATRGRAGPRPPFRYAGEVPRAAGEMS